MLRWLSFERQTSFQGVTLGTGTSDGNYQMIILGVGIFILIPTSVRSVQFVFPVCDFVASFTVSKILLWFTRRRGKGEIINDVVEAFRRCAEMEENFHRRP